MAQSAVDRVYLAIRRMAIDFQFLPGERLNEALLAKQLGVSRTPLREALNRLCAEGFLTFSANNGFFRKTIEVKEVFDLYEFRMCLEHAAVGLAVERATEEQLRAIERFAMASAKEDPSRTEEQMVSLDEQFHEQLVALAGNTEIVEALRGVNARIQFVRWVDMTERRGQTQHQHLVILEHIRKRELVEAQQTIHDHIAHRLDQIVDKVERSFGRIFVRKHQAAMSLPEQEPAETSV